MDHSRVNISPLAISCAVLGLSSITDDTRGVMYQIATRLYHPSRGDPAACIVWSDVVNENSEGAGYSIAKWVDDYNMGWISESDDAENPKTGNIIRVVTWIVNHNTFKKWYAEERAQRIRKVGT